MGGDDGLRLLAASEIGAKPDHPLAVVTGDPQRQRAAGVIMPDLGCIDAMPMGSFTARERKNKA